MHTLEKRRAKRIEKSKADKDLLALERQYNELWRQKREMPSIPLPEPIQDGWKRHLVLRSDIANRGDSNIFRDILRKITKTQYSKDGKFTYRNHNLKRDIEYGKQFRPLGVGEFKNIFDQTRPKWMTQTQWTDQHKKWFNKEPQTKYWIKEGGWTRSFTGHWFGAPDYYFEWEVEPHYLTHYRELDGEVESTLTKLNDVLWDNWKNNGRLKKLHGHRGYRHDDWNHSAAGEAAKEAFAFYMKEIRNPEYADDYHIK